MSVVAVLRQGLPEVIWSTRRDPATVKTVLPETQTALYEYSRYLGPMDRRDGTQRGGASGRCEGESKPVARLRAQERGLGSTHDRLPWRQSMVIGDGEGRGGRGARASA